MSGVAALQRLAQLVEQCRPSYQRIAVVRGFCNRHLLAHRCDEPIAALGYGFDVDRLLGPVAQDFADSKNVLLDDFGIDVRARPQSLENLFLRDQAVSVLDQILKEIKTLRGQRRACRTPPEATVDWIEPEVMKRFQCRSMRQRAPSGPVAR